MKVYGVSAYDIENVVREVSQASYDGNVIIKSIADQSNSRGPRARFTLRVVNSAAGQRGALGRPSGTGTGPNGMGRGISACWHAHWDVIEKLFERFPNARVASGLRLHGSPVRYTAETFKDVARQTAHLNVGSGFAPVTMPQCCECDHSLYCEDSPQVQPELSQEPELVQPVRSIRPLLGTPKPSGTAYTGVYQEFSDGAHEPTAAPDEGDWWAHGSNAGSADTTTPYLGGVRAAQPFTAGRRTAEETVAAIDQVLAGEE